MSKGRLLVGLLAVALVLVVVLAALRAYRDGRLRTAIDRNQPDSLPEIRALLDRGADIRTRGHDGDTVATVAAWWNDPELLKRAIDAGVDPNAADVFGNTALIGATFAIGEETTRLLLAAGADVNHQSKSGETALLSAVRNARHDLIPLLLAAGAKVDTANAKGETALSLAKGLKPGVGPRPMRPDLTADDFVRMLESRR